MKFLNKKIIFFSAIVSFAIIASPLIFFGGNYRVAGKFGVKSLVSVTPLISQAELGENYKKYAANIFSLFYNKDAKYSSPEISEEARKELLALDVPSEFRDLHFNLIIGLGLVEEGARGDKIAFTAGEERLLEILKYNPWLLQGNF